VKRGGSFGYYGGNLRVSYRLDCSPSDDYGYDLGFRCVRSE